MERKVIRTTFYMGEFLEEEKWLEMQHKEGWKFVRTDGKHYEFMKCLPEEWIYQLDFKQNGIAEDNYLQIFADCGWEFVQQYRKWFIFRKKKEENDVDISIFSDNVSRIEMCKRIINWRFLKTIPLIFLALGWDCLLFFSGCLLGEGIIRDLLAGAGTCMIMLIVAAGCSQFHAQRKKIKKTIAELKNPLQ